MSQENINAAVERNKLLSIGRAWYNDRQNESGTSPALTIRIDRGLGINITIGAENQLLLFKNQKRDGRQDADYRVAIALPAEVVDREIARQQAASQGTTATVTPAPVQQQMTA